MIVQIAEGAEGAEAEKPPKAPASLYSKNEAPVQLVLCVDTMGQVCVRVCRECVCGCVCVRGMCVCACVV